jgi:hypothetical protein
MDVHTKFVERDGRYLGELRFELTPLEGQDLPPDGPYSLMLEGREVFLIGGKPEDLILFAVTSTVEHNEDSTAITFLLDRSQMEKLKSRGSNLFPDLPKNSRDGKIAFEIRMHPMIIELEDGRHHILFIAPEWFFADLAKEGGPPFVPLLEDGVWQDVGHPRYLDQQIKLHDDPPESPYLFLRGKEIDYAGIPKTVWEFEDEAALQTYMGWAENRKRREITESN